MNPLITALGIQIQKSSISLKSPPFLLHYYNDLNQKIALSQQHVPLQSYEHMHRIAFHPHYCVLEHDYGMLPLCHRNELEGPLTRRATCLFPPSK